MALQEQVADLAARGFTSDEIVEQLATPDMPPRTLHLLENQAAIAAQSAQKHRFRARRGVRSGREGFTMVDHLVRDEVWGNIKMVDFGLLMYFIFEFERYHDNPIEHLDVTAADMAKRAHLSRPTVQEALDRLVETGLLLREERRDADGHRMPTRYRLLRDVLVDRPR